MGKTNFEEYNKDSLAELQEQILRNIRKELDTINELDQQGNLYTRKPYDRCPLCHKLNSAIIASSSPANRCSYCGQLSYLKDWTRFCQGEERPRPQTSKHFW